MHTRPLPMNIVVFMQGTHYIAQCLEYDLGAQGKTIGELKKSFMRVLAAQVTMDQKAGRAPLEGIPRAPSKYFEMWEHAEPLAAKNEPIPLGDLGAEGEAPPSWMIAQLNELRVV